MTLSVRGQKHEAVLTGDWWRLEFLTPGCRGGKPAISIVWSREVATREARQLIADWGLRCASIVAVGEIAEALC